MTDQNQTDHTETNLLFYNEEDKRSKRTVGQESMNTKNFLKKMATKKQQKEQPKITNFLNMSNSTTYQTKEENLIINLSEQSGELRIRQLQERMKVKDLQIEKMRKNKQIDQNKYSLLYISNKQYKKKSKNAIATSMLEAAEFRRAQRREINPKLGYFKDGCKTFVEGSLIKSLRERILQKYELIKSFEDDKKSKDPQKRERALFKIEFINKEITGIQKQIENHQIYINSYKQQLKLAQKEFDCEYALQGWPIVFQQYQTLQLLGKGGFGQVYKVYDLQSNQVVSLKVSTFNQAPEHQQDFIKHVNRQAEIMKKLHHPNIGKFYRLIECTANRVTFTLQYCSGPELSVYLRKNTCLEQKQAKQIVRQILAALSYLYNLKQRVIHYDLKPSNIMFHNGVIKILDFGLCKPMETQESKIQLTCPGVGTYWYLPPECFDQHFPMISQKVDVWSTGVIFYEMLYGRKPFGHGKSQNKVMNEGIILNARKVEFLPETPKKHKVSEAAKNFIRQLLAYEINDRLDPDQAYEHQYFKR